MKNKISDSVGIPNKSTLNIISAKIITSDVFSLQLNYIIRFIKNKQYGALRFLNIHTKQNFTSFFFYGVIQPI